MIHGVEVVEVPIPRGKAEEARSFYGTVLGFRELSRSSSHSREQGIYFALPDGRELLLDASETFRPLRKSQPTFEFRDLEAVVERLGKSGHRTEWDFSTSRYRFYCIDPFGNRLEFITES